MPGLWALVQHCCIRNCSYAQWGTNSSSKLSQMTKETLPSTPFPWGDDPTRSDRARDQNCLIKAASKVAEGCKSSRKTEENYRRRNAWKLRYTPLSHCWHVHALSLAPYNDINANPWKLKSVQTLPWQQERSWLGERCHVKQNSRSRSLASLLAYCQKSFIQIV